MTSIVATLRRRTAVASVSTVIQQEKASENETGASARAAVPQWPTEWTLLLTMILRMMNRILIMMIFVFGADSAVLVVDESNEKML